MHSTRLLSSVLIVVCVGIAEAQQPIAKYSFNSNLNNEGTGKGTCDINRYVELLDDAISIHGKYGDFEVFCGTPEIDCERFTVVLRFKYDIQFGGHPDLILMAGKNYRWFGLSRTLSGKLALMFNSNQFNENFPNSSVSVGEWHSIACAVNIPERRVASFIDGEDAGSIELPTGFRLTKPIPDRYELRHPFYGDKHFLFTDFSNGRIFNGLVDELIVFDYVLTGKEMEALTHFKDR